MNQDSSGSKQAELEISQFNISRLGHSTVTHEELPLGPLIHPTGF